MENKETKQNVEEEPVFTLTPEPQHADRASSYQRYSNLLKNKVMEYFGKAFDRDIVRLSAKERIEIYIKLAPFAMPKLQATSVEPMNSVDLSGSKNQLIDLAKKFDKSKPHTEVNVNNIKNSPQQTLSN